MNYKQISRGVKNRAYNYINQRRGWTTNRKIVVIESDDWGSIRMPSRDVYDKCLKEGYSVNKNFYEMYDSLESEDDLSHLFEVLVKYKDTNGNPAQFTANTLIANPDFDQIIKSNNSEYFYETVDKTFASYPHHKNCIKLWQTGGNEKIFDIQYHGKEHLNVNYFMNNLSLKKEEALWALNNYMLGSITKHGDNKNRYVEATRGHTKNDLEEIRKRILEGLQIFKRMHQKQSESYIATNYRWTSEIETDLYKEGVSFIQGSSIQLMPLENGNEKNVYHYIGEKNNLNQLYLVRNCLFEPTVIPKNDAVNNCLKQIHQAFNLNKPAIISSHRVNYIGSIFEENRIKNLKLLKCLLSAIIKQWPNVEFMNSTQLGRVIITSY